VRPLFVDGLAQRNQIVVTVLSHDMENDPDVLAVVAASEALTLSGAPFKGPIGAAVSASSTTNTCSIDAGRNGRHPARPRVAALRIVLMVNRSQGTQRRYQLARVMFGTGISSRWSTRSSSGGKPRKSRATSRVVDESALKRKSSG